MLMLLFHAEGFVRATLCGRIFILYCVESLTSLVEKMERRDNFHGIKEADHMKFILNMYETTSGQTLNLQKSEANLMLEGERSWNENLVQMLLLDENEANDVLRAPIYNCIHSDIRIWGHESNGDIVPTHVRLRENRVDCSSVCILCNSAASQQKKLSLSLLPLFSSLRKRYSLQGYGAFGGPEMINYRTAILCVVLLHQTITLAGQPLPLIFSSVMMMLLSLEAILTAWGSSRKDDSGAFAIARTGWETPCMNIIEGEAMGVLKALTWLTELSLTHVIVESDCKVVLDKINNFDTDVTEIGCHC
ncbi:hypothetical protein glysoja_044863 [Glycine soja]|uniref:RNase H type-1 domain-containing protein n=1 Tax=Glycine soja TaxID=3848 RepID=A0A0B2RTI4_GLYSO|nr:hypothetical protein JHK87_001479 [Glycine soja]KAG5088876.1 hypothetical protein JHK86_001488 [Glycine max]KHN35574.1 hypothetical protein glysoja_044863 [Glycine soja]